MDRCDVIIVGARVAGAATALLLARAGLDVVVVDRATAGSDTLSTHALMRPGVVQLDRWGVLDDIAAAGTPPIERTTFHYGPETVPIDLSVPLYAPRRTVLDRLLVEAASRAGADVRFRTRVESLRRDWSGRAVGVRVRTPAGEVHDIAAAWTVGADGARSLVARESGAPVVERGRGSGGVVYGYAAGIPNTGYHWHYAPGASAGLIPTNDGLTCAWVEVRADRLPHALRGDRAVALGDLAGEVDAGLGRRLRGARFEGPVRGHPGRAGLVRRAWGPGWALVGDAGYCIDPITAHGISGALRDAELLARALSESDVDSQRRGLSRYEDIRDHLSRPLFDATDAVAALDWDLETLREHHLALSAGMKAETAFLRALSPAAQAELTVPSARM